MGSLSCSLSRSCINLLRYLWESELSGVAWFFVFHFPPTDLESNISWWRWIHITVILGFWCHHKREALYLRTRSSHIQLQQTKHKLKINSNITRHTHTHTHKQNKTKQNKTKQKQVKIPIMNSHVAPAFIDYVGLGALWVRCLTSNNEGVEYMKTGRFEEASESLITSLGAAKSILCHHQIQPPLQQQQQKVGGCWTLPIVATSLHCIGAGVETDHRSDDDLRGVYRDMYVFPHTPTTIQVLLGCTEECLDTLCMVIVFNLALSHHLRVAHAVCRHHDCHDRHHQRQQQQQRMTNISNAMALYELVHNMQQHRNSHPVSGGGSSSSSPVRALREELYLAVLCNLGHVHTMLGQNDKAGAFFQHLLAVMMFLQSSTLGVGGATQTYPNTPIIKPSARETFSWCICSNVLENQNTAPAAWFDRWLFEVSIWIASSTTPLFRVWSQTIPVSETFS